MEKTDWEKLIENLTKDGVLHSSQVIKAVRSIPREKFLPENMKSYGAVDTPLPIGFGQTASAPHMVSIMNEALRLEIGHKVLEVGAGSGWHAATIAETIAPSDAPTQPLSSSLFSSSISSRTGTADVSPRIPSASAR